MALREVEEADYNAARGVVTVVDQIMKNPEARKLILQARKIADPNVSIPEIDATTPVNASLTEVKGELASLRADLAERDRKATEEKTLRQFEEKWNGQAAVLRAKGWREAGIDQVKTFAEENGIADLSIAADAWEARNPAPAPSTSGGGLFGMFGGQADDKDTFIEDMMKAGGNDDARLDREIAATLADVRSGR